MSAINDFALHQSNWVAPFSDGFAITPHDTNELANVTRAIYVGGAGNIALTTVNGDSITLAGLALGDWVPIRAKIVLSTGTTATNLVGLF